MILEIQSRNKLYSLKVQAMAWCTQLEIWMEKSIYTAISCQVTDHGYKVKALFHSMFLC